MFITRLTLRDFRNYARADVELGPGLNVVCGPNGAGKTNLLEALYFSLTARSCRTSNEREVVRLGESVTRVVASVADDDRAHTLEVGFAPGEEKRVRIDGAPLERGAAPPPRPLACVFLPERLELVKGAPANRRGHLDQLVAALWPARAETRAAYSRALSQRNALIGRIRAGASLERHLDPWDYELARHGIELMADRSRAVAAVAPHFAERGRDLGMPDPVELRYLARSKADDLEALRRELGERRGADIERGFTQHGPHRDDMSLLHGGRLLRTLGSQGQQRVGLLALLFAERDVLAARRRPPLMLLDDVMSELDATRRERLSDLLRERGQSLVTTTDVEHVPGAATADDVMVTSVLDGTATQGTPVAA
jgi:DNA replication and repair protein RecF